MGTLAGAVAESEVLLRACLPAPPAGPDVCRLCHGWTRPGYPVCYPCRLTSGQVSWPCARVEVVSLYRTGGVLHRALRGYKDGPPATRAVLSGRVAALVTRFLWEQGPVLAPAGWDGIVVVPSTTGRPGCHPLERALAGSRWLAPQLLTGVLGRGPVEAHHRAAADRVFTVAPEAELAGARVLLLDDTWTTGARAQSAASALQTAGAEVTAAVVVGRVVTPVAGAPTGTWWERHAGGRAGGAGRPGGGGRAHRSDRRGAAPQA